MCSMCGKIRDKSHDWSKDCESCSTCRKPRWSSHNWEGCKCSACGKTRDEDHDWSKDGKTCITCGRTMFALIDSFFKAIENSNLRETKELLKACHGLVNTRSRDAGTLLHAAHSTPLHWAVSQVSREGVSIVELLLANGAEVNARDDKGQIPLHIAADIRAARLLLANGADVSVKDNDGLTPLFHWLDSNWLQRTRLLIVNNADVNAKDKNGATPLHLAAREGDLSIAELLLSGGAQVNVRDNDGMTPLLYARAREREFNAHYSEVEKLLLACGADVNMTQLSASEQISLDDKLVSAIKAVDAGAVGRFLLAGAKAESRTIKEAQSALHEAIAKRDQLKKQERIPSKYDPDYYHLLSWCTRGEREVIIRGDAAEEILQRLSESRVPHP